RIAPPRVVDEDAAHGLRRCRHEMRPVLPLHAFVVDQPHVGFIDQRRRLQAVAGLLTLHEVVRQTVELVVHDRGQPGERALVAVGPRTQQRTDVVEKVFTRARSLRHCRWSRHCKKLSPSLPLIALSRLPRLSAESGGLKTYGRAELTWYAGSHEASRSAV